MKPKLRTAELLRFANNELHGLYAMDDPAPAVTLPQASVLRALNRDGAVVQGTLVEKLGIDRSSLSEIVGRMIVLGYIFKRRSTADRRTVVISITPVGRAALHSVEIRTRRAEQALLYCVPAIHRNSFLKGLAAIAGSAA